MASVPVGILRRQYPRSSFELFPSSVLPVAYHEIFPFFLLVARHISVRDRKDRARLRASDPGKGGYYRMARPFTVRPMGCRILTLDKRGADVAEANGGDLLPELNISVLTSPWNGPVLSPLTEDKG